MKLFEQEWFSIISFFMVVIVSLNLSACRNPKGEDGVSTLSISIHTDVKNAGDYEACVGGLTKGSGFGCVIKSGNTDYPLQENQPYLHNAGTYDLKLSVNGSDNHTSSYTIEVDEGKAGSDPRKGIDGKNRSYVLKFKLNEHVLSVTED